VVPRYPREVVVEVPLLDHLCSFGPCASIPNLKKRPSHRLRHRLRLRVQANQDMILHPCFFREISVNGMRREVQHMEHFRLAGRNDGSLPVTRSSLVTRSSQVLLNVLIFTIFCICIQRRMSLLGVHPHTLSKTMQRQNPHLGEDYVALLGVSPLTVPVETTGQSLGPCFQLLSLNTNGLQSSVPITLHTSRGRPHFSNNSE
jgi:hypothetical protein